MRILDSDFFTPALPRSIAHRGASGTLPENTMAAFAAARDLGVPYIELDVHMTRDGVVVVSHDGELMRTCGAPGRIAELDYAEVAQADAGFSFSLDGRNFPFRGRGLTIPTLADVLSAFGGVQFIIEVKQTAPGLVGAMLKVIEDVAMRRRVLIASEHQQPIDEVRTLWPDVPTNFPAGEVANFFRALTANDASYKPAGDALQIPPSYNGMRLVSAQSVAAAHRAGIEVHIWTVNDPAEMRDLLALGCDGILSDYPDRLLDVVRDRL